jgi:hypothetical protein
VRRELGLAVARVIRRRSSRFLFSDDRIIHFGIDPFLELTLNFPHLFQGRYKAIFVETDENAEELSWYIHLNSVRAKLVEAPELT